VKAVQGGRYLRIYLDDHVALATVAAELARRTLRENGDGELGAFLRWLHPQLLEDRAALVALLRSRGGAPSRAKSAGARAAEKLGRLKPNGHLRSYSPLSRLVELDGLAALLDLKLAVCAALREAGVDADVEGLAARAREQRERLEPHRLAAAAALA
jgi:hypothetical protein